MANKQSGEARLRAEASFKKNSSALRRATKPGEHLAAGKAADAYRAQRLAREAAVKPSTPRGARQEKPPTGTKGEEISSQGQVDEGTKRRSRPRSSAKSQEPRT